VSREIRTEPLTAAGFAPYGDVLDVSGEPDKLINQGLCGRYHDRAKLVYDGGRAGISLFDAVPRSLPYQLAMMERHPLGSQAFLPLSADPFLVVVAPDDGGRPGRPVAFLSEPYVGVNYHANVWHGVLTPLSAPGRFAVIDRIGPGANLEEYWFDEAYVIEG
jgi:ureidoglycolate lyase